MTLLNDEGLEITHPAIFADAPSAPATRPIPFERLIRGYRLDALNGIRHAWGHRPALNLPDSEIAAWRLPNLPASQAPAPVEREPNPKTVPVTVHPNGFATIPSSKYGKRLPLRAFDYRDLNREFWSKGRPVYHDLERSEPRELLAHEKSALEPVTKRICAQHNDLTLETPCRCPLGTVQTVSTAGGMSVDELVATQSREPLSESRRSWLTRGAGVMSLEGIAYDEGSIGETVAAQGVDLDTLVAADADFDLNEEHDAVRFGTPIELLDPITAKQIDWEQEQHGNSEVTTVRVVQQTRSESAEAPALPVLSFAADRKMIPDVAKRVFGSVKRSLAAELRGCTTLDEFHARIDLAHSALVDSGVTRDFGSADPDEERERFLAPADLEWHTAYERVRPMIAILSEDWSLKQCNRPGCQTFEEHEHVRFAQAVHRRPQNVGSQDEFWRQRIFDVTAFELGTDGLVDPLVREFQR